jgi:chromosome segregation ATPase
MRRILALAAALCVAAAPMALAQQKDSPEDRLRAALRTATQRVRELEDQNADLTAKQAQAERDRQALADKSAAQDKELALLHQQTDADKAALDQSQSHIQAQDQNIAKWQASYQEAADAARTRDADAKRLDALLGKSRQRVQVCEQKNAELYKLGEQALDLYDHQDFLDAIAAGEPVTKLKRVEIENAMQDYEDKMRDDKVSAAGQ